MSINRECLGREYGPAQLAVDAERIADYAHATGDQLPLYRGADPIAPPVFAIVPVWPLIKEALADDELGLDVGRIVHGEQRMTFHRPIRAGDALTSSGNLSSITERGENEVFVLSFETRDGAGSLVTSQDVVCVSRGTALAKSAGERVSEHSRAGRDDVESEPELVRRVELPPGITHRYAGASGDDNRIHIDDEFAKSVGLPGIIVQGMCLFSISMQAVIDAAAGGRPELLSSASVRFRRPILPGTAFETLVYLNGDEARFEGRGPGGELAVQGAAKPHVDGSRGIR
jgi:acyl dehydratase